MEYRLRPWISWGFLQNNNDQAIKKMEWKVAVYIPWIKYIYLIYIYICVCLCVCVCMCVCMCARVCVLYKCLTKFKLNLKIKNGWRRLSVNISTSFLSKQITNKTLSIISREFWYQTSPPTRKKERYLLFWVLMRISSNGCKASSWRWRRQNGK